MDCGYSSASLIISFVPIGRISEALLEPTIKTLSFAIVVTIPLFSVKVRKNFLSLRIVCVVALSTKHRIFSFFMGCYLKIFYANL